VEARTLGGGDVYRLCFTDGRLTSKEILHGGNG